MRRVNRVPSPRPRRESGFSPVLVRYGEPVTIPGTRIQLAICTPGEVEVGWRVIS